MVPVEASDGETSPKGSPKYRQPWGSPFTPQSRTVGSNTVMIIPHALGPFTISANHFKAVNISSMLSSPYWAEKATLLFFMAKAGLELSLSCFLSLVLSPPGLMGSLAFHAVLLLLLLPHFRLFVWPGRKHLLPPFRPPPSPWPGK